MDRRRALAWTLALASPLWFGGCGEDDPSGPGTAAPVSFADDLGPVFQQNCSQCHIAGVDRGDLRLVGDEAYDELVGTVSNGYAPRLRVAAGEPDSSVLYIKIAGDELGGRMPPTGALAPELVELVRRWIDEGAPDN